MVKWCRLTPLLQCRSNQIVLSILTFSVFTQDIQEILETTISNENIEAMKKQLEISGEVIDTYGEFAVLVTDIEEFVSRVTKALDRCGFKYRGRFVHYYDPENRPRGDNWFDPFETPFFKRDKFKNENEYRFVIEQGTTDPDALKLDIGDIRDISIYMVSREINDRTVVSAD